MQRCKGPAPTRLIHNDYWPPQSNTESTYFIIWRLSPAPVHNYIHYCIPSHAAQLQSRCITTKTTSENSESLLISENKEIENENRSENLRFSPQIYRVKYSNLISPYCVDLLQIPFSAQITLIFALLFIVIAAYLLQSTTNRQKQRFEFGKKICEGRNSSDRKI